VKPLPTSVSMVRETREPFPLHPLPAGYAVTWFRPGCEHWWYDIQAEADKLTAITRQTFSKYFGEAPAELPRRQCFLIDGESRPVGTATAWFDRQRPGGDWGRLHWVAIRPAWQGCGLGRALLSAVCQRLRQLHPDRAYLRTASQRLAAIHLYLSFGFVPEIRGPEDEVLWTRIRSDLGKAPQAVSAGGFSSRRTSRGRDAPV
jgi:GNAT superfamily N-acetyltransferase